MKFKNYLENLSEMKKRMHTMVGFQVPFSQVKKTSDHIRSYLDRYSIDYQYNQNPHITIAQILGKYRKDSLTRAIQQTDTKLQFHFKKLTMFQGYYTGRSYIVLELKNNNKYREIVSYFENKFPEFKGFPEGMKPHVSLMNVELGTVDEYLWKDILTTVPLPGQITTKGIDLYNSKFSVEYSFKSKKK